jgi:folate-binding protein YgfZ
MIPAVSASAYDAARHRAAFLDRSHRGRIVVSGTERASYLQGLMTNDIVALKAGEGCYSAYLTAQGRMIADLYVYELGDVILLAMTGGVKDAVLAKLDQFIFSEDVQLGDVTATFAQIAVVGPDAARVVASIVGLAEDALRGLPVHGNARGDWSGGAAIVVRIADAGEAGFDLFVEQGQADALKAAFAAAGAVALDEATAEAVRIESGMPLFGRDMDEDTIPLEAGIESRAISFTKGCYVGQEVIVRITHRGGGRVAKKLVKWVADPSADIVPLPESRIFSFDPSTSLRAGKDIGRVTSAAFSPNVNRVVGLGYVHRDFAESGTDVTVVWNDSRIKAVVQ